MIHCCHRRRIGILWTTVVCTVCSGWQLSTLVRIAFQLLPAAMGLVTHVTHGDLRHWPKRVGAVVDILYADTGRVRKKYDSTTEGRSVTISPSVKACNSHKTYKHIKKLQENKERIIS